MKVAPIESRCFAPSGLALELAALHRTAVNLRLPEFELIVAVQALGCED
jgi:hypothetical protein